MKQIDDSILENAIAYLEQLKVDLEKEKTKLMDIYIDVHGNQKSIDVYIDSLKNLLGYYEAIKVTYDWDKAEVIEVPLCAREKQ